MAGLPRAAGAPLSTFLVPESRSAGLDAVVAGRMGLWQLSCWERGTSLLGRRHNYPTSFHHCRSTSPDLLPSLVHPPFLEHYLPCKSTPAYLMLLPFILVPAVCYFTGGAAKPCANSGQTLLHCDLLRLETSLGTSGIAAFWKSRHHIKLSSADSSYRL